MPVVEKLMTSLVAKYGEAKGKQIYYAMEAEGSGPFAKGAKYHSLHLSFVDRNGLPGPNEGKTKRAKGVRSARKVKPNKRRS